MAHYLAVDWDATELRVVYAASQRGSIKILQAESAPLEHEEGTNGAQNVDLGLTLKQLVKEHKVPHAPLILGLNRASVDMMTFRLPRSKPEDLPDLVKNQALRDSPGFTETSPIDFISSPASDGDFIRTIAATVSKTQLKQFRGMCHTAGFRAKRIEFRPLALAELYWSSSGGYAVTTPATSGHDTVAPLSDDQPVLLVQCTTSDVDMVVVEGSNVAFVRSIKLPESLNDEERTNRIVSEIARTIAVSRQEVEGAALAKVIVYGNADEFTSLQERLADQEIETVVANPFRLPCVVAPAKAKITGLSENPGHYAALFGMILSEQSKSPVRIDFLHPREKPQPLNIARFVVLFLLLFGVIGLGGYLWNKRHINQLRAQLAGLQTDIEKLDLEYRQMNPRYVQLLNASEWDNRQLMWLDELRDISLRLPDEQDMVIDQIRFVFSQPHCIIDLLARVRDTGVIQQIAARFQSDNNHVVTVDNQRPISGGGGYPIFCSIRIRVAKRDNSYYRYFLTPDLQQLSQQMPDFPQGDREQGAGDREQGLVGDREQGTGSREQEKPALPHVLPQEYVPHEEGTGGREQGAEEQEMSDAEQDVSEEEQDNAAEQNPEEEESNEEQATRNSITPSPLLLATHNSQLATQKDVSHEKLA